ncbi:hypothetical protein EVC27_026 [Rhizobium phage RHph_I1_6]|uniref:Uncharacterized protein n=1 Tax=Rhizobium phage RHph_I1_6 TaxID=2509728 RepID=A0A7S5V1E7_9CAUD|nr:hypothetical protein PP745_gp026 [Rhizobium phage RHph_I1_6]QIG76551.1 hypothetical protein EVC27_026 [Rhizobium phage RHph_I1_6]
MGTKGEIVYGEKAVQAFDPPETVNGQSFKEIIAIDFGSIEYQVLMHYIQEQDGVRIISVDMGGENLLLDTYPTGRIVNSRPEPWDVPKEVHRIQRKDRDRKGDYRFDYGRNNHPRSPRKR